MKKYSKKYRFQRPKKKTRSHEFDDAILEIIASEPVVEAEPLIEEEIIEEIQPEPILVKEESAPFIEPEPLFEEQPTVEEVIDEPIVEEQEIYTGPINEETEEPIKILPLVVKQPEEDLDYLYTGPINEETEEPAYEVKIEPAVEQEPAIEENQAVHDCSLDCDPTVEFVSLHKNLEQEFELFKQGAEVTTAKAPVTIREYVVYKHQKQEPVRIFKQERVVANPKPKVEEIKAQIQSELVIEQPTSKEVKNDQQNIQVDEDNDEYYGPKGFYHKPEVLRVQRQETFLQTKKLKKICKMEKYFGRFYACQCARQHTHKETYLSILQRSLSKNNTNQFNFENFSKNVEYKTFSDGSKLKIAAEIKNIHLSFTNPAVPGQKNKVLRGPSLEVYEGKVHAIIGESGSGKSVITSLLYGLTGDNAVIDSGEIKLYNNNVENFSFNDWEKSNYRGRVVSAVFQNPMSTLNPTMKVGAQIMEGMLLNKVVKNRKEAYTRAIEFLKLTKINDPEAVMKLYPHEMSGGMIQRVVIAAIVALEPKILVMDEPTTALDPTVQALVLDVIKELQEKLKLAIVFITHDLGVVASIADYISIMYAGQIIEEGAANEILSYPQHPYTWGLISSMPDVNKGSRLATIRGSVPSNLNKIVGDAFAVRNDYAMGKDLIDEPDFYWISDTHRVKSALLDEQAQKYYAPYLIQDIWKEYLDKNETRKN